jgi:nucleotide-binding universal stress UspA family protein
MPELASQGSPDTRSTDFQFAPETILFATDFSRACQNAWPYAVAVRHEYHSKLLLAHVIDPGIFAAVPSELVGTAREQVRREREDQLKKFERPEKSSQPPFELLLLEGEIAEVLLRIVQERVIGCRYSRAQRDRTAATGFHCGDALSAGELPFTYCP